MFLNATITSVDFLKPGKFKRKLGEERAATYSIQQQQHMHITADVLTRKYVRLLFIQGTNVGYEIPKCKYFEKYFCWLRHSEHYAGIRQYVCTIIFLFPLNGLFSAILVQSIRVNVNVVCPRNTA